jgi:hypothetical protein
MFPDRPYRRLTVASAGALFLLVTALAGPGLAQQPRGAKIAKIEFEGSRHLTREQLLTATASKLGPQRRGPDAAGQRLMDSGLLKNLSYRVRIPEQRSHRHF